MNKQRISLQDSAMDVMVKMSDGNPGAMKVLMELLSITQDNPDGGWGTVLMLDSLGIYGTDIYVLYNDICNSELIKTIAVIRAVQLGYFSGDILKDACSRQDYSGRDLVPVDELYQRVVEQLSTGSDSGINIERSLN